VSSGSNSLIQGVSLSQWVGGNAWTDTPWLAFAAVLGGGLNDWLYVIDCHGPGLCRKKNRSTLSMSLGPYASGMARDLTKYCGFLKIVFQGRYRPHQH
jgi:hypothetical protein